MGIDTLICAGVVFTVFEAIALLAAAGTATYALYQSCIVQHGCDRVAIDLQRLLDSRNATFDTGTAPSFQGETFPQGPPVPTPVPLIPQQPRPDSAVPFPLDSQACKLPTDSGGFSWLDPQSQPRTVSTGGGDVGTQRGPVV